MTLFCKALWPPKCWGCEVVAGGLEEVIHSFNDCISHEQCSVPFGHCHGVRWRHLPSTELLQLFPMALHRIGHSRARRPSPPPPGAAQPLQGKCTAHTWLPGMCRPVIPLFDLLIITWPWLSLGSKGFQSLMLSNALWGAPEIGWCAQTARWGKSYKTSSTWSHQMHLVLEDCLLQGTKFQTWNWEMYREQFSRSSLVCYKKGLLPGSYFSGR